MALDVVIFAIIAVIVLYRLYLTLGDQSGFDPRRASDIRKSQINDQENVEAVHKQNNTVEQNDLTSLDPTIQNQIKAIIKIDPEFKLGEFVRGATLAYEMTLEAYAKENLDDLKNLLSPTLFDAFKTSIDNRRELSQVYENTLIKLDDAVITDAKLNGSIARLSVKFISEQVPVLKDKEGEIVEGNPDQIDQVIDQWVFEKSLKSSNPNWVIVETDA